MSMIELRERIAAIESAISEIKEVLDNHESELTALSETVFEPIGNKDYNS